MIQHRTWLLEFNLEDSPLSRPSPVVDLDDYTQDSLAIEVPAPEDMYEYNFRTRPVATEMDQIHQGLARAVQRMPVLQELYLVTGTGRYIGITGTMLSYINLMRIEGWPLRIGEACRDIHRPKKWLSFGRRWRRFEGFNLRF